MQNNHHRLERQDGQHQGEDRKQSADLDHREDGYRIRTNSNRECREEPAEKKEKRHARQVQSKKCARIGRKIERLLEGISIREGLDGFHQNIIIQAALVNSWR